MIKELNRKIQKHSEKSVTQREKNINYTSSSKYAVQGGLKWLFEPFVFEKNLFSNFNHSRSFLKL